MCCPVVNLLLLLVIEVKAGGTRSLLYPLVKVFCTRAHVEPRIPPPVSLVGSASAVSQSYYSKTFWHFEMACYIDLWSKKPHRKLVMTQHVMTQQARAQGAGRQCDCMDHGGSKQKAGR